MLINDSPLLGWAHHTPKHSPTVFLGPAPSLLNYVGEGMRQSVRMEWSAIGIGEYIGRLAPVGLESFPFLPLSHFEPGKQGCRARRQAYETP